MVFWCWNGNKYCLFFRISCFVSQLNFHFNDLDNLITMLQYSSKWLIQRITAFCLIPLTFWFLYSCLLFTEMNFYQLNNFFKSPFNAIIFLLMILITLFHSKLGCDTIIEDYVSSKKLKYLSLFLINFLIYSSGFIVIISILKILIL